MSMKLILPVSYDIVESVILPVLLAKGERSITVTFGSLKMPTAEQFLTTFGVMNHSSVIGKMFRDAEVNWNTLKNIYSTQTQKLAAENTLVAPLTTYTGTNL